ncbi:MAG: MBL fold metallo-hydrolase [Gammaproteobacteria bacterium]|nr:MAG: MBL fold metallo-hydrolase [Gammaproteobacteria bacterium]
MRLITWFLLLGMVSFAHSEPAPSIEIQKVTEDVYALVGQRGPMSRWNMGTNATFGVIVTGAGVVLIDPGASLKAAEYIHTTIDKITAKPVVLVINTGSEDLRWLGNSYFKSRGARIITSRAALAHQKLRETDLLGRLDNLITLQFSAGTTAVFADEAFEKEKKLTIGNTEIILRYSGPSYMPGDFYVWLPEQKVVFTGDIVSTERMLAVARTSKTKSWINNFRMIEALNPEFVVPGHGHATDIKKARADTLDYLLLLRKTVGDFLDKGGQAEDISSLNNESPLSPYERLIGYDMLKGRNALHVYMEMEWE